MKKVPIKTLIVIAIIIFAVGIAIFFYIKNTSSPKTTQILLTENIPQYISGSYVTESNLSEEDFNFPKTLPILENNSLKSYSINDVQVFASNLGFSENPKIVNDVAEGQTYIWNKPSASLTIYGRSRKISYSLLSETPNSSQQLGTQEIIEVATNFLVNNHFFTKDQIKFESLNNINAQAEGIKTIDDKNSSSLYQVTFAYLFTEYPIVTSIPGYAPINVTLFQDGTISSVKISNLESVTKSIIEYKLKDFKTVQDSLKDAKVVSLDDGNIILQDLANNPIQKIIINRIQLGYLFTSPTSAAILPIYIFNGTAILNPNGQEVEAILYMPAIAN